MNSSADINHDYQQQHKRSMGQCRSIDSFTIHSMIGEGTYGQIYKCTDRNNDNRQVALKKVKLYNEQQDGFPITSLREITCLRACIGHRNCVQLIDIAVGRLRDEVYLVLEYCDHDLELLLSKFHYPFSESDIKSVMHQILSAVSFIHDRGMIHRDIKPSNILYDQYGCIKLADFGSCRYENRRGNMTVKICSLWYRAPELLLGSRQYYSSIDEWSVGCIFGQLLIKQPLFSGQNEVDQINQIFETLGCPNMIIWPELDQLPLVKDGTIDFARARRRNEYNNLLVLCPSLSKEGFELLNRLLAYDPSRRLTANDAMNHVYFECIPLPTNDPLMPTFPSTFDEKRVDS